MGRKIAGGDFVLVSLRYSVLACEKGDLEKHEDLIGVFGESGIACVCGSPYGLLKM